jgi:hypothetical protein
MRDPTRIARTLHRIEALWSLYPDWRLGQLMLNLAEWADDDLWNLEDDRLLEVLEEHLSRRPSQAEVH